MKKKEKKKIYLLSIFIIKLLLILLIFYIFINLTQKGESTFSNEIHLLSVSTDEEDNIIGERLIPLKLTIKKGSGDLFINSNGIIETDTQLSIRNAKETTCTLLELHCNSYDFYFSFTQDQLLLEGPSAGAAVGILVAKTILREDIPKNIGITGSLSSGGVIGVVGGVEEKVALTNKANYKKIIIPQLSSYNDSQTYDVEVIRVLDLFEALKQFDTTLSLEMNTLETKEYTTLMKSLSDNLCERSEFLSSKISKNFSKNNSNYRIYTQAMNTLNSSQQALERESYYSRASFCFGANNNLRSLLELEKNESLEKLNTSVFELSLLIDQKIENIESQEYRRSIKTLNYFYVWLILTDRVYEAKEFITSTIELLKSNESNSTKESIHIGYAYAQERLITVELWEEFIVHQGEKITFSDRSLIQACSALFNEVLLKEKVLEQYEVEVFDQSILDLETSINEIGSQTQCIYSSLELGARIDTVISSVGIASENSSGFAEKLFTITKTRLSMHDEDSFPLIPFIYFDYAEELYSQGEYSSALLYTNYALSFGNLELYLYKNPTASDVLQESSQEILIHPLFVLALLLLVGFLR